MILNAKESIDGRSYETFLGLAQRFGAKAAGLTILPKPWTPQFTAVSVELHEDWAKTRKLDANVAQDIFRWIEKNSISNLIVRSSGINERIEDRGKFESVVITEVSNEKQITESIQNIFERAFETDENERLGLVLHEYLTPEMRGHLSNEVRVSPTRNQWKYEIEVPWVPIKGLIPAADFTDRLFHAPNFSFRLR